jgi:uncharacterized protein YcbK (DUF882 family)
VPARPNLHAVVLGVVFLVLGGATGTSAATSLPTAGKPAASKPAVGKPARPAGKTPAAKQPRKTYPPVVLYHVNRKETLRLRLYDDKGRPVKGMQRQVDQFLRCHHTNRRHAMNPRLTRLIYETGRAFPGKRIEVISGYRHPRVAKNPRSPHKKGLACDMRVEGVKNNELRDFFRIRFEKVGVGFYPNSSFVHLDVRKGPSAFWIDWSGPGESASYSDNALDDLRTGRADTGRRTTIDPSWADEEEDEGQHPPESAQTAIPASSAPSAAVSPES